MACAHSFYSMSPHPPEFLLYPSYQWDPGRHCRVLTPNLALSCTAVGCFWFLFSIARQNQNTSLTESPVGDSALLATQPAIYSDVSHLSHPVRLPSLPKASAPVCPLLTLTVNRMPLYSLPLGPTISLPSSQKSPPSSVSQRSALLRILTQAPPCCCFCIS